MRFGIVASLTLASILGRRLGHVSNHCRRADSRASPGRLRAILEDMALLQRLPVDEAQLDAFCRRWKIAKLELFGSTLIDPSRAQDVDLLVTFSEDARWGLFEHERMQDELAGMLGRNVDLISRRAIEGSRNALRRNAILSSAVPVYVAG
jgi:uncharacterized protein